MNHAKKHPNQAFTCPSHRLLQHPAWVSNNKTSIAIESKGGLFSVQWIFPSPDFFDIFVYRMFHHGIFHDLQHFSINFPMFSMIFIMFPSNFPGFLTSPPSPLVPPRWSTHLPGVTLGPSTRTIGSRPQSSLPQRARSQREW